MIVCTFVWMDRLKMLGIQKKTIMLILVNFLPLKGICNAFSTQRVLYSIKLTEQLLQGANCLYSY